MPSLDTRSLLPHKSPFKVRLTEPQFYAQKCTPAEARPLVTHIRPKEFP